MNRHLAPARFAARIVLALVAWSCLAAQVLAAGPTPAEAHQAAKDAAAALPSGRSWVTLPQQQDKLGVYGAGANEAKFQGGKGNASPDGATRAGACMGANDPECLAIQVLQQGRSKAALVVPAGSPQLTGRNLVVGDPAGTTGIDPEATAQVVNNVQCTTITTTIPEVRERTTCDATTPYEKLTCTIGVLVEVDPDWVYQCLYRTASNVDSVCSVGQVVVVDKTVTYQCVEQLRTMNASTCTVGQVVTVRSDTEYQCLVRTRLVGDASCSVDQVVVLDPNYQYRCTANPNAMTSNTCNRTLEMDCPITCGANGVSWSSIPAGATLDGPIVALISPGVWQTYFRLNKDSGGSNVSSTLTISGTITGSTVDLISAGWGLKINGVEVFTTSTATNRLIAGANVFSVFSKGAASSYEDAVVMINLNGYYCVNQACTETWSTTCGPYTSRL